ncbi:MAG: DUF2905 family protein [Nitrosopumilaceae archaeon]|nr:DUF2905 family protein [Nitrosopumilaceae archaeon]NIV66733.1 DUF2905 family protein [Nitrosopumilaceae archaeon]
MIIYFGVFLIILGVLVHFYPKIPLLGKLPGDIHIKRENFSIYFPIVTSILLSIVISLVLYLFSKLK